MIDLDDRRAIDAADPGGMLAAVERLSKQCGEGYAIGTSIEGLPDPTGLSGVVISGMGSSAVAGDVLRSLYRGRLGLPIEVNRSPQLPAWCGPATLLLVVSYSGNTAEALVAFEEARARGCRLCAITSGGSLAREAAAAGIPVVRIPGGFMPRAAFGYVALSTLGALESMGLLPRLGDDVAETIAELEALAERLGPGMPRPHNDAKELAWRIGDRTPVIWGAEGIGSVAAARWKTQLNENAKVPAWSSALPELDHNEVVGWRSSFGGSYFVVALRHEGETSDVSVRFPPTIEIATEAGAAVHEVWAAGRSPLARLFSLVMMGDFVSTYHGIGHGVDPSPIEPIARLKAALAEAGR